MTLSPEIKIAQQRLSERRTWRDILPVQPPMQEFPGKDGATFHLEMETGDNGQSAGKTRGELSKRWSA